MSGHSVGYTHGSEEGKSPPAEYGSCRNNFPIFILFGPTAVGKTRIVESLFTDNNASFSWPFPAEIISADSMQVYRGMNIGTAKPDAGLCNKLPHHLLDIRKPDEQFNAGDFVRHAEDAAREISFRGKLPVISGGTGFYINSFISGLPDTPPSDDAIRAELKKELQTKGAAVLMEELAEHDAISAARIHINDQYRLLRALEVFRLTGRPLSSFKRQTTSHENQSARKLLVFGLAREREDLYERINARCASMIKKGLYDEVRNLFENSYTPEDPALKAIGYKEFFYKNSDGKYVMFEKNRLDEIRECIAQNSRQYAKRQMTYFKNVMPSKWFFLPKGPSAVDDVLVKIKDELLFFLEKETI
ncbi:MAG: tRNA (adenosine(37)-N6)-dimethylallyltransferase MiaA [Spirochaetaceae bacterium]|nr:tRNA (adenosine(37)-N6)-dimethylallyltransferase MiaA [Spirochaetaceae bacterium]